MKVIGIIAEYNPFHNGHLHHLRQSREQLGEDCVVVCAMSGNFVQRGDVALFDKHTRAEAAVRCGADLVFELPLPWALSSAEGFSRGAVGLLGSLGVVTHLSFGSEAGSVEPLSAIAIALMEPSFNAKIKAELDAEGIPYAVARQRALTAQLGELARHIESPNNILAVEYMKALYSLRIGIEPMTVPRSGAGHDRFGPGLKSGAELRAIIESGRSIVEYIPREAGETFSAASAQGRGPVTMKDVETAILSRLRFMGEQAFHSAPDATEGLGNRLCRAAWTEPSFDAVLSAAKTKRYALSRLRRMLICVALGVKAGMADETPPYARLLAASDSGRGLLRQISEKSRIPVITKPAQVKTLGAQERALFDLEAAACDLYVLGRQAKEERRGGCDWRESPRIVQGSSRNE